MVNSRERVRSMRLSEVVLLALALAMLVSVLVVFPSRSASAVPPSEADYRLQGKLSTSVGTAPALQRIGPGTNTFTTATVDGSSRKVLGFPKGNGLKLVSTTNVVPRTAPYTIVVLFELNNVGDDQSRFRRFVDFKNGASDSGLYVEKDGNQQAEFLQAGHRISQGYHPYCERTGTSRSRSPATPAGW